MMRHNALDDDETGAPTKIVDLAAGADSAYLSIEAQGFARISGLGPMFLTLKKYFKFTDGTCAGTREEWAGSELRG
jgi:hypothetical protein